MEQDKRERELQVIAEVRAEVEAEATLIKERKHLAWCLVGLNRELRKAIKAADYILENWEDTDLLGYWNLKDMVARNLELIGLLDRENQAAQEEQASQDPGPLGHRAWQGQPTT